VIIREGQEVSAFWEALGRNDTKNDDMDTQVMCIQGYSVHLTSGISFHETEESHSTNLIPF